MFVAQSKEAHAPKTDRQRTTFAAIPKAQRTVFKDQCQEETSDSDDQQAELEKKFQAMIMQEAQER